MSIWLNVLHVTNPKKAVTMQPFMDDSLDSIFIPVTSRSEVMINFIQSNRVTITSLFPSSHKSILINKLNEKNRTCKCSSSYKWIYKHSYWAAQGSIFPLMGLKYHGYMVISISDPNCTPKQVLPTTFYGYHWLMIMVGHSYIPN